jgi:predicted MFS family arabinose efflux permease
MMITGATIMIWFAPNIVLQVVGRMLQGIAAAIVWITGLAMTADTVGQENVGEYVSYLGIALMTGT